MGRRAAGTALLAAGICAAGASAAYGGATAYPAGGTYELGSSTLVISTPLAAGTCIVSAPGYRSIPVAPGNYNAFRYPFWFDVVTSRCAPNGGSPAFTLTGANWLLQADWPNGVDFRMPWNSLTVSVPSLRCRLSGGNSTNPGGIWTNGFGSVPSSVAYVGSVRATWADDGGTCASSGVASAISLLRGTTFIVQTPGSPTTTVAIGP